MKKKSLILLACLLYAAFSWSQQPNYWEFNTALDPNNSNILSLGSTGTWEVSVNGINGPYFPAVRVAQLNLWAPQENQGVKGFGWISYPYTCYPNNPPIDPRDHGEPKG